MFFWPCIIVRINLFDNQLNAQFLYSITICMLHYNPRHVSSINKPIFRRTNCFITAIGIVTLCKRQYSMLSAGILYCRLQRVTIPDCDNTICPPEDGHVNARNMSRVVMQHKYCYKIKELCIKLVIEISHFFCLSGFLLWSWRLHMTPKLW
jgi:hypothetical protein